MVVAPFVSWWDSHYWKAYEAVCGIRKSRREELSEALFTTRVIDLRQSVEDLASDLRKGHRSDVKRSLHDFHVRVIQDQEKMEQFRRMHIGVSGRETRPKASWDLMADWMRQGHLVLVGAVEAKASTDADEWIGFAAFYVWGRWAYYGSSATTAPRVSHGLIWTAMLELKRIGVERFEIGWQQEAESEKGKRIEFFKRGFGGVDVPAAQGEHGWA